VEEELEEGIFPKGWASGLTAMRIIAGEDMVPLLLDQVVFIVASCCESKRAQWFHC
jgi:hypothetical protein